MRKINGEVKTFFFWHYDDDGKWLLENVSERWHEVPAHSKGDLISRMSKYALCTGDVDVIKSLIKLVNAGKRWPDSLSNKGDCKNRLQYWWGRQMFFHFGADKHKYGPQKNLSRDCFVMLYAAIYWWQYEMINDIKVPLKINRFSLHYWIKALKSYGEVREKHKRKYEFLSKIGIRHTKNIKGYVKSLTALKAFIIKSDVVKGHLMTKIPHWNLLNRLFCGDKGISESDVNSLIPHSGYIWNSDTLPIGLRELGPNEPFYLDKDFLIFAYKNRNF